MNWGNPFDSPISLDTAFDEASDEECFAAGIDSRPTGDADKEVFMGELGGLSGERTALELGMTVEKSIKSAARTQN
jgi:hypothetical protein